MSAREPIVSVTHGMRGWFCVFLTWNPDHGGFYEPWTSSPASYDTPEEAAIEARWWALDEGVACSHYGPVPQEIA